MSGTVIPLRSPRAGAAPATSPAQQSTSPSIGSLLLIVGGGVALYLWAKSAATREAEERRVQLLEAKLAAAERAETMRPPYGMYPPSPRWGW